MSERHEGSEYSREDDALLRDDEVRTLAGMAITYGEMRDANNVTLQPPGRPRPHFFVLAIDPTALDVVRHRRRGMNLEITTAITIEYNEAMVIVRDQAPMEPWVSVTVASTVYDDGTGDVIDKEVRYRLSVESPDVREVVEERSGATSRAVWPDDEDPHVIFQSVANEARPLSADDVWLLRLLISQG